ncbi:UxaA family hydrolase [Cetobacterium sp.]|uniref:UxaA family hydrolase n=1 Tax=Cetobacterium sp. TaxID=2071632 RepID=UPI003AF1B79A
MIKALVIDKKDNVGVVIEPGIKGDKVIYKVNENIEKTTLLTNIPIYHKFAIIDINKGNPIIKYGEHIGLAAQDIKKGEHIHEHNIESHREVLK